jgi:hypothetical protein
MKRVASDLSRLRRFQEHFQRALAGASDADIDDGVAHLVTQPGFAVYRNTVRKGCIDALQANFPAVTRLVGEEWMRAAAAVFARSSPPSSPMLLDYGAGFAQFLQGFEPAADLPYLADVARLDRFWTEAHGARDASALDPASVAALTPDELASLVLRPHPAARWAWFERQPIFTIWSRNRCEADAAADFAWHGEGALIVRPADAVQWYALGRAGCALLDACAASLPLAEAAQAALAVDAGADLSALMAQLFAAGAFSAPDPAQPLRPTPEELP